MYESGQRAHTVAPASLLWGLCGRGRDYRKLHLQFPCARKDPFSLFESERDSAANELTPGYSRNSVTFFSLSSTRSFFHIGPYAPSRTPAPASPPPLSDRLCAFVRVFRSPLPLSLSLSSLQLLKIAFPLNYTGGGTARPGKVRESKREGREKSYAGRERKRGGRGGGRGKTEKGVKCKESRSGRQRIVKKKRRKKADGGSAVRGKRIEFGANRVIRWKPPAVS